MLLWTSSGYISGDFRRPSTLSFIWFISMLHHLILLISLSCIGTSQASRDPSAHGRVKSSLTHRLALPTTIVAAQSECRNGVTWLWYSCLRDGSRAERGTESVVHCYGSRPASWLLIYEARAFQVVPGIISGKDVFAVLLTGFGKSLCFACLPIVFDLVLPIGEPSIVFVVALLMTIMKDQVNVFCMNNCCYLEVWAT